MSLTVTQKLNIASVSEYYSESSIIKGGLFGSGIDLELPQKIYNIRKSIDYWNTLDSSDTTLEFTSNYLLALCGKFQFVSQSIITGSGGVTPSPTPTISPAPIQFVVDASTSYIIAGETTKVISIYAGFNLLFVRNGIPQSTVDDGVNTYYSWDKPTGTLSLLKNGVPDGAVVSELFQLFPF